MNYEKIYNDIITNRKQNVLTLGYFETHHIVPKSMGGSDDKCNLVKLTAREHFLCHWLLYKIYKNKEMGFALHSMRMTKGDMAHLTSHKYETMRVAFSDSQKGSKNHMYGNIGDKHHLYGSTMSEETKNKISNSQKGKKASQETKDKLSKLRKGKKHPQYGMRGFNSINGKKVIQRTMDGKFLKTYGSVRDASRELNIPHSNIVNCCLGKCYKSAGGYVWSYKEEEL